MNLRKLFIPILSIVLVCLSCSPDDETEFTPVPLRNKLEVYNENVIEIKDFLETHFFNYDDFDFTDATNPLNNEFTIVLDEISVANGTQNKTPIYNYLNQPAGVYPRLDIKIINQDDIDYNLYILKVREGSGDAVNLLDRAAVIYKGSVPNGNVFDSQVSIESGQPFNLTEVGNTGGVVRGFREGIVEFKTATGFTENADGSISYSNHGLGVVFMPSGLGYFALPPSSAIPQYAPLFFNLKVISRSNTDWDVDGIPSHIEHPDGNIDGLEDNTDGDLLVNFIDNDDDGDGVLTRFEVQKKEYEDDGVNQFMSKADAQMFFGGITTPDEIFISITGELDGTFTLNTLLVPDDNNDGTPNYLDSSVTTSLE